MLKGGLGAMEFETACFKCETTKELRKFMLAKVPLRRGIFLTQAKIERGKILLIPKLRHFVFNKERQLNNCLPLNLLILHQHVDTCSAMLIFNLYGVLF